MNTETAVPVDATKSELLALLYSFVNQRPRLDFADYGDVSLYRLWVRKITRQRSDALTMLRQVELRDSITAADMVAAFRNRLTLARTKKGKLCLEYCAGQYWATEYRAAVASLASSLLWHYWRECADCVKDGKPTESAGIVNVASYIRQKAKREFGRGIASRWFN